jgi:Ser/Thr protein kinase RdoA (MazF antagonist)
VPPDPEQLHRIAEGREAEIFASEPGRVLKLYRSRTDAPRAEWEAAATAAVVAAGGRAPHPFGLVSVGERPGLVLERVDGPDLVTTMGRRPWTVRTAGGLMGRTHAALHEVAAPATLPATRASLERRIRGAGAPAGWQEAGLRRLDALPDGDRLCHNDFHPQNVLLTAQGPIVIDWPAATRGEPAADVARTVLLLTVGAPLPSAPLRVRLLAPVVLGALRGSYLAAYRSARPLPDATLRAWLLPVAIARLGEAIPGERGRLDRFIRRLLAH